VVWIGSELGGVAEGFFLKKMWKRWKIGRIRMEMDQGCGMRSEPSSVELSLAHFGSVAAHFPLSGMLLIVNAALTWLS